MDSYYRDVYHEECDNTEYDRRSWSKSMSISPRSSRSPRSCSPPSRDREQGDRRFTVSPTYDLNFCDRSPYRRSRSRTFDPPREERNDADDDCVITHYTPPRFRDDTRFAMDEEGLRGNAPMVAARSDDLVQPVQQDRQYQLPATVYGKPHYKLVLSYLPLDVSRTSILTRMYRQGFDVRDVRVIRNRKGGDHCFGFAEFRDVATAEAFMVYNQGKFLLEDGTVTTLQYSRDGLETQSNGSGWLCAKNRLACFGCELSKDESDRLTRKGLTAVGSARCNTLLFRELPLSCTENKIEESVVKVAGIRPVAVHIADSKLYAYVQMASVNDADDVLASFDRHPLTVDSCNVLITYSRLPLNTVLSTQQIETIGARARSPPPSVAAPAPAPFTLPNAGGPSSSKLVDDGFEAEAARRALARVAMLRQMTESGAANIPPPELFSTLDSSVGTNYAAPSTNVKPPAPLGDKPTMPGPGSEEIVPPSLGVVETPWGLFRKFPPPNPTVLVFEPKNGLYFDRTTGLYYDCNSQYYWDSADKKWRCWNSTYQTYIPYDLMCDSTRGTAAPPVEPRAKKMNEEMKELEKLRNDRNIEETKGKEKPKDERRTEEKKGKDKSRDYRKTDEKREKEKSRDERRNEEKREKEKNSSRSSDRHRHQNSHHHHQNPSETTRKVSESPRKPSESSRKKRWETEEKESEKSVLAAKKAKSSKLESITSVSRAFDAPGKSSRSPPPIKITFKPLRNNLWKPPIDEPSPEHADDDFDGIPLGGHSAQNVARLPPPSIVDPLADSAAATRAPVSAMESYIDVQKVTCVLCVRKFDTLQNLMDHLKHSDLHKKNVEAHILQSSMASSSRPSGASTSNLAYRPNQPSMPPIGNNAAFSSSTSANFPSRTSAVRVPRNTSMNPTIGYPPPPVNSSAVDFGAGYGREPANVNMVYRNEAPVPLNRALGGGRMPQAAPPYDGYGIGMNAYTQYGYYPFPTAASSSYIDTRNVPPRVTMQNKRR